MGRTPAGSIVALLAVATIAACGTTKPTDTKGPGMSALGTQKMPDGAVIEMYDLSGDHKPNLWKIYEMVGDPKKPESAKKTLVRKDMDLNRDGKVDVRQFLDANGVMYKEEMDLDFDGNIDAVATYKDGKIFKREMDMTLNGRADIVKFYEGGDLVRKERDTNDDGRMDVWEYFESGRLVRRGLDKDGDGKPEIFDDAPPPPPELPGGAPGG